MLPHPCPLLQSKSPSFFAWTTAALLPSLLQPVPPGIQASYSSGGAFHLGQSPQVGNKIAASSWSWSVRLYMIWPLPRSPLHLSLLAVLQKHQTLSHVKAWRCSFFFVKYLPLDLHTADCFWSFSFQVRCHLFVDFCGHPIGCISQSLYHIVLF